MRGQDLALRIVGQLRETFAPLIDTRTPVALAGFPDTLDCSRAASWLGAKQLLAELGAQVAYECSAQTYNRDEMAARIGKGTIVVCGGESSGSSLREDFPNNKIVFLTKDCASDASFMLRIQLRSTEPVYETLWIGRTDSESADDTTEAAARLSSQAAEKFELPAFDDGVEMHFAVKHRPHTILLTDWTSIFFENVQNRNTVKALGFDVQARIYLSRAIYMLSLGHVVITDRLHGHILCLLLGIPHILLNSKSGKNWEFHQHWTRDAQLCRLAASPAEAWSFARHALPAIKELKAVAAENWSWKDF